MSDFSPIHEWEENLISESPEREIEPSVSMEATEYMEPAAQAEEETAVFNTATLQSNLPIVKTPIQRRLELLAGYSKFNATVTLSNVKRNYFRPNVNLKRESFIDFSACFSKSKIKFCKRAKLCYFCKRPNHIVSACPLLRPGSTL